MITVKIANKIFNIYPLYDYLAEYCKDYMVPTVADEEADGVIVVSQKDILFEREKSAAEDRREGNPIREFSEDYLETLAVYRKIATQMLDFHTLLFHGSVIAVDGKGYLFTAKSGTGKSTHTNLWLEQFGDRAVIVNDDKPLLTIEASGVLVHGTPWDGKHRRSKNMSVPLQSICILERGQENRIRKVTKGEVYAMLLQQVYKPTTEGNPILMKKTLELLDQVAELVGLYKLQCNMEPEAAIVAYEGMVENR